MTIPTVFDAGRILHLEFLDDRIHSGYRQEQGRVLVDDVSEAQHIR